MYLYLTYRIPCPVPPSASVLPSISTVYAYPPLFLAYIIKYNWLSPS